MKPTCPALAILFFSAIAAARAQQMTGYAHRPVRRNDRSRPMSSRARIRIQRRPSQKHYRVRHMSPELRPRPKRDYVIAHMKAWGLETELRAYSVWMPHATRVQVSRSRPRHGAVDLREPPIPGDPTSSSPQYPTVNGYSGPGDVTGEVVYVNYGLIEDYAQLDSLGVAWAARSRSRATGDRSAESRRERRRSTARWR